MNRLFIPIFFFIYLKYYCILTVFGHYEVIHIFNIVNFLTAVGANFPFVNIFFHI